MKLSSGYQITIYCPPEEVEHLVTKIFEVDPLRAGNYQEVAWWSTQVTEQFRPLPGATPDEGKVGELYRGPSAAIVICIPRDKSLLERIIKEGVIPHHPWEKPAFSVIKCKYPSYNGDTLTSEN